MQGPVLGVRFSPVFQKACVFIDRDIHDACPSYVTLVHVFLYLPRGWGGARYPTSWGIFLEFPM